MAGHFFRPHVEWAMLKTRIPPPIYALLTAWGMWLLHHHMPILQCWNFPWRHLAWIPVGGGLILDGWSVWLFFQHRTTVNPMKPANARSLVTGGFYQYTRNPMYLGLLLLLFGWAIWLGSLSPYFLLPLFVMLLNELQIKPEENALTSYFCEEYIRYKSRVGRWFGRRGDVR